MELKEFCTLTDLYSKKEIDKVKIISFYYQMKKDDYCFSIDEMMDIFQSLGMHSPNKSRLKERIVKSKSFIKGKEKDTYILHIRDFTNLKNDYSSILEHFETSKISLKSNGEVLDKELYAKTRKYIFNLADQINSAYENNIFDGCAVLMRRLFEILLIHAYQNMNLDSEIKDNLGNYVMLAEIVKNAKVNTELGLSRNTRNKLDNFRELGNFSAHKIYYNAKKSDIDREIFNYRATIEELLYISGFKN